MISKMLSNKSSTLAWNAASPFAAATVNLLASRNAIIVAGFCCTFKYAVLARLYDNAAVILF